MQFTTNRTRSLHDHIPASRPAAANLDGGMRRQSQTQRPARGSVPPPGDAEGPPASAGPDQPRPKLPRALPQRLPPTARQPRELQRRGPLAGRLLRKLRPHEAPVAGLTGRLPRELRLRWALVAGLAGGLALTATFPPYGIWPLAAAGPAILAVALRGQSLRGSFAVGAVFGLAFFFPLLSWVVNLAWYAWAALAVSEALIFAVLAAGQRLLLRLRAWPAAVAGWWVAIEAFRDRWPWGGFPW